MIPQSLRLNVAEVPCDFDGALYFILGPGLGDTVNGFRILHEVSALYHKAAPIVYLDPRWRDLYPMVPELARADIRFYQAALSADVAAPMTGTRSEQPYHHTFQAIVEQIVGESGTRPAYVAAGAFKLSDQLSRKEPNIPMQARAIGLDLSEDRRRPYLPLTEAWVGKGREFLECKGLNPGEYLVLAPETWQDKMWDPRSWQELAAKIQQELRLPILLIGTARQCKLDGELLHEAIGLPLPLVAALLSQAAGFVGLDSGPAHIAAAFDVPVVSVNPQGKFPPFLIEPHTFRRWTVLTPGIYGSEPIAVAATWHVLRRALADRTPPRCPSCAELPYVLEARSQDLLLLCRCGLLYRDPVETTGMNHQGSSDRLPLTLPGTRSGLFEVRARLVAAVRGNSHAPFLDDILFEHHDPVTLHPGDLLENRPGCDLWWTWDAAYRFLLSTGLKISRNRIGPVREPTDATRKVHVSARSGPPQGQEADLEIPWGPHTFRLPASMYERWLAWGCFRKTEELEGLGWQLVKDGHVKEGRRLLRCCLRVGPRFRTIRRMLRAQWSGSGHS